MNQQWTYLFKGAVEIGDSSLGAEVILEGKKVQGFSPRFVTSSGFQLQETNKQGCSWLVSAAYLSLQAAPIPAKR